MPTDKKINRKTLLSNIQTIAEKYDCTIEIGGFDSDRKYFKSRFIKNKDNEYVTVIKFPCTYAPASLSNYDRLYDTDFDVSYVVDFEHGITEDINSGVTDPYSTVTFPSINYMSINDFIKRLDVLLGTGYSSTIKWRDIKNDVKEQIPKKLHGSPLEAFFDRTDLDEEDLQVEKDDITLGDKIENELFQTLLHKATFDTLCRYTSLGSIVRTLNDKKQSMCSLVCMNDPSECSYAYEKLGIPMESDPVSLGNDFYIMSLVDKFKYNDLTMYRLYGDNAEGVCIKYTVDQPMIDNPANGFILAPVSYGSKSSHPELSFLKKLMSSNIQKRSIKFLHFSVWSHFFKPYEYEVEKEIRLLIHKPMSTATTDRKWLHDSASNVVAPILLFDVTELGNNFPLIINKILIGPKSTSKEFNVRQLGILAKDHAIKTSNGTDDLCGMSNINVYR